jgi:hypothetical protein
VPDVLKNERLQFYRIPKLGAYMAVPLTVSSTLQISSLEAGIEERRRWRAVHDEYLKLKEVKMVELQNEIN